MTEYVSQDLIKEAAKKTAVLLYDYCRKHLSLENEGERWKNRFDCPAKRAGLIDHIWSLSELLTHPYYKTQTY